MNKVVIIFRLKIIFYLLFIFISSCKNVGLKEKQEIENTIVSLNNNKVKFNFTFLDSSFRKLTEKSREIGYKNGEIKALTALVNLYFENGNFDSAINYNNIVLNLRKNIHDTANIINSYINIANCYAKLNQNVSQKKYLDLVYPLILKTKDTINIIRFYTNLGIYYYSNNFHTKAKNELSKAINISELNQSENYLAIALLNYGNVLIQEDSDSSVLYLKKCELIFSKQKNYPALVGVYNNLAESYWITNEPKFIIESLYKAYSLLADYGSPVDWQNILSNLAFYYQENGNYEKSIIYYQKLDSIKSVFFNESMATRIANIEKDYTVKLKTEENAKLKAQVSRKNTIRNAAIISAILLSLLGLYQYRNYKQKRKLTENQKQLKDQEIAQLLKEKELKNMDALFEGREEERKRIGRDLHDRLGSMLSTVKLHFSAIETRIDDLKKDNQTQYNKATALLDEAVGEVRKIAHDLVSGTLVNNGLSAALFEMKNTIEETGKLKVNIFETGNINNKDIEFEIAIYRIVQELISNVMKHANASKVDIYLTQTETDFTLIVEDNGKGFDTKAQANGIGMANIKQRVEKLGGTLSIDTKPSKGTSVIVEIEGT